MNKEFISYEEALELKELGYDEPCIAFYELDNKQVQVVGVEQRYNNPELLRMKDFCAPLYQQAFRWFREKHGLYYIIQGIGGGINYDFSINKARVVSTALNYIPYPTYEEAELACLKKLIEIVKNK